MANLFLNLPAPVADGDGAGVDTSAMGKVRTITVEGDLGGASITIQISNDGGASFVDLLSTSQPTKKTLKVAAQFMRVRVAGIKPNVAYAPNIDVGCNDVGAQFVNLPATAGDGTGAQIDVSALGTFKTAVVTGDFTGQVMIQISEDGVDWADCLTFDRADHKSLAFVAQFARVVRAGSGVPVGAARVDLGGVNDPISQAPAAQMFSGDLSGLRMSFVDTDNVALAVGRAADSTNAQIIDVTVPLNADITVNGANGLDVGVEAPDSWYALYVIDGPGVAVASLLSLSFVAPTLPVGYTVFRRVGAVRNGPAGDILSFNQVWNGRTRKVWWDDLAALGLLVNSAGGVVVPTLADASAYAPPTSRNVGMLVTFIPAVNAADSVFVQQPGFATPQIQLRTGVTPANQAVSYHSGPRDTILSGVQTFEWFTTLGGAVTINIGWWDDEL